MTLKIKVLDGAVFSGETAQDIIDQMRKDAWNAGESEAEFMAGYAQRAKMFVRGRIRTDTPDHFIEDMIARKMMEPVAPTEEGNKP